LSLDDWKENAAVSLPLELRNSLGGEIAPPASGRGQTPAVCVEP
jgi:hypothetical protein